MIGWPWLALGTAVCETARDLTLRHLIRGREGQAGCTPRMVMGSSALASAVLTVPLLLGTAGALDAINGPALAGVLLTTATVNGLAYWAYGRALAKADVSLVLPLINLSPLALLLSGWWLLGERPGSLAVLGVALVVAGALLLSRSSGGVVALLRNPGARSMLMVALLWGLGASLDKLGLRAAGLLAWMVCFNASIAMALLLPPWPESQPTPWPPFNATRWWLLLGLSGLLAAAGMGMQMEAIGQTAVVHVVAIKRLSTLLTATAGVVWLGEQQGKLRLPAAALMLAGAATILWLALAR